MYSFIDIHSHIHDERFDEDRDALVVKLKSQGGATIAVGTDYIESQKAKECALKYENVYYCAGIHPVDKREEEFDRDKLFKLANHPKCVGIGECGLDYYWPQAEDWYKKPEEEGYVFREQFEKARQEELFNNQIKLALELDLPLMIHGRPSKGTMDAYVDIIKILKVYKKKHKEKLRGNIHFFVGDIAVAKDFLELGFTMSFTGVVTFTHDYDEVIQYLPLERIQVETDAPYVAPKVYRGRRNEPKYVIEVITTIVELKGVDQEVLEQQLIKNAYKVWGI